MTNPPTSREAPAVFGLLLCLIVYALFILNIIDLMGGGGGVMLITEDAMLFVFAPGIKKHL